MPALQGLEKFLNAASSDPDTVLHYEFMQARERQAAAAVAVACLCVRGGGWWLWWLGGCVHECGGVHGVLLAIALPSLPGPSLHRLGCIPRPGVISSSSTSP